jgi:outer membrane receptor protein involved in Fe transport
LYLPAVSTLLGIFLCPAAVQAQTLEEIVVTAQRRTQTLQEVPVSIEAFSGAEIDKQGFRDMIDLTQFSPGATIDAGQDRINITIRGVGTAGNNQALEQSAPTFVDGIHFGRSGQILAAFLDAERIEILRGPQPIYFGQNANAGAFSITTRKPTPEWEASLRAEAGNQDKNTVEFGAGGPINDTWGIRVAGKYDRSSGYMKDILTGDTFPKYQVFMGRAILQWKPTDNFQATAKYQVANLQTQGEGNAVAKTKGSDDGTYRAERYARDLLITGVPNANLQPLPDELGAWGIRPSLEYLNPTLAGVPWRPSADRTSIDLSGFLPDYMATAPYGSTGPDSIEAHDNLKPWDAYLDLRYTLDNGIELSSVTGYSYYARENSEDNSGQYFLSNYTFRSEFLDQWTQEFRLTSPTGGTFEWMAGLYYQDNALDLKTIGLRSNVRRPARNPTGFEDAEWLSGFAALTFNFLDNKASIDLGGRYTDVKKHGGQVQFVQEWIFADVNNPGQEFIIPNGTTHKNFLKNYPDYVGVTPIGMTPEYQAPADGVEINDARINETHFDPQVVVRFRPTDDISLYAKYATAFKAGGFEVELKSTPQPEDFVFGPEDSTIYEVGARGSFLDGRARAGITAFKNTVANLQIGTTLSLAVVTNTGTASSTVNAGKLRVNGIEADGEFAATDRMTLSFNGALYDGKMVSFKNAGCTDAELAFNECDNPEDETIDRSGQRLPRLPSWVFSAGADYWYPVMGSYKITFDGRFKYSDGYVTNIESFSKRIQMPTHTDLNLSLGFADIDNVWELSLYGRNLMEPRPKYYPEYDVLPGPILYQTLSSTSFATYGVQLRYNF